MTLTRRHSLYLFCGAALISSLPLSAQAHRQKTTLSQIEWNESEKALYVTHSYHMHDAETALAVRGIIAKPDLTSLRSRAKLALYTDTHFQLSSEGQKVDLEILGADFQARTVYVYQQVFLDEKPTSLTVSAAMLRDIIPGQINHVDLHLTEEVKSVKFKDGDGPKKILT